MSKLQVLLSCMHEKSPETIYRRMNLQSDSIIVNQCDDFGYQSKKIKGKQCLFISCPERGVGLSRNTALMRSDAEIAVFADDDEVFVDGYEQKIIGEFDKHPEADAIVFNVENDDKARPMYQNTNFKRLRFYNSLRYGTVRLAVRVDKIKQNNINFSLLFGGGAKYSNGEDSIFITDILKSGLKLYASPIKIADLEAGDSTWFKGYNKKFFVDRGVLFRRLSRFLAPVLILRFAIKERAKYQDQMSFKQALSYMLSRQEDRG